MDRRKSKKRKAKYSVVDKTEVPEKVKNFFSPCLTEADEGFTEASTNRPSLQRLLEDVGAGLVDALIVYQLDRISRDVRYFSNIYATLEEKGVMFISIKETIDTNLTGCVK